MPRAGLHPEGGGGGGGTTVTVDGVEVDPLEITTDVTAADIAFVPNGTIASTDVQAAIQEVRDEAGGGTLAASSVTFSPSGNIAASDVQAAIVEVNAEAAPLVPLLVPVIGIPTANLTQASINGNIHFARFVVHKAGTLSGIALCLSVTSGNVRAVVYDTGDASTGNRSLLYDSGSVAAPGAPGWQQIAAPSLAVTRGQQIDIGFETDNTTLGVSRGIMPTNIELPNGWLPAAGGASPKLASHYSKATFATAAPSTIAEASLTTNGLFYGILAKVT